MAYLDSNETDRRVVDTLSILKPPEVIMPRSKGREGDSNYTDNERVMMAVLGQLEGSCKVAARLELNASAVSNFSLGKPTCDSREKVDPVFKERVDKIAETFRERLAGKACGRIEKVLDSISDEKIQEVTKANDLGSLASSLSGVVNKLSPILNREERTNNVHFHFFRPRTKAEDEYQIIDVEQDNV